MTEDNKENQQNAEAPAPAPAVIAIDVKKLRYFSVMRMLVFSPKLALMLIGARGFLFKTIMTMVLLCLFGSCVLTMSQLPDYTDDITGATAFLADTVGGIAIGQEGLEWKKENLEGTLPKAIRLPHTRLDIAEHFSDIQESELAFSGDEWGLILSREGVRQWMIHSNKTENNGAGLFMADCITKEQIANIKKKLGIEKEAMPLLLNPDKQEEFKAVLTLALFMTLTLMHFLMILKLLMMCGVGAGFVALFVGGRGCFCGFHGVLSMGLNMTFMPAFVAFFYSMTGFAGSFSSAYCVCFMGYLLYAAIEGRNGKMIHAHKTPER